MPTIYHRLFARLSELVPDFEAANVGAVFYAPPRIAGDMAVTCSVAAISGGMMVLELVHDQMVNGREAVAPWLVFNVDLAARSAELMAAQEELEYTIATSRGTQSNARRVSMNSYANNWLASMLHLHSVFQPVQADCALPA
ncbi:hypothetical protein DBR42_01080 [Pelomonas sp. HMWF004]|nr:hypothetical protein DBR42_01080 [Pelomonas sp. HMWF004]